MLGEGLWSHGTLTLRSFPSPYYSLLTPALIGAPLAALDLADGIQWARLLQALAMSLVAVPTYLWARRFASAWWAVAAAALVLVSPVLHYAGFLMTEPLTLTVVTVALLMLARALEEPSMWRYGVFVGWATAAAAVRLQALVLLPAFLLAAVVDSVAARDRTRLRPLLWFAALAAAAAGLVVAVIARRRRGTLDPAAPRRIHAGRRGDGRRCRAAARGRVARVRRRRSRPRRHAARIGCPRVDGAVPPRHGSRPARLRLDRARATRRSSSSRSGSSPPSSWARSPSATCSPSCRCSRSGSARGSRAAHRARSRSCSRSGASSSSARPRCRSRSSRRPRRSRMHRRPPASCDSAPRAGPAPHSSPPPSPRAPSCSGSRGASHG